MCIVISFHELLNHNFKQEEMNVICECYSTLTILHLCIDYIQFPNGQLKMVPMPVVQYGYP